MNASDALSDVQSSSYGVDLVGDAITAMRIGEPQVARALLQPPWGLRFPAVGAAGVHVILKGRAWLLAPGDADPILLSAGDVALVRRRKPHGLADDPASSLWDADLAQPRAAEHWPRDGSALDARTRGTALIGGTYDLNGARPHPLLESLPDVVHLPARVGLTSDVRTVVELLGAEMDRDLPGVSAATPALARSPAAVRDADVVREARGPERLGPGGSRPGGRDRACARSSANRRIGGRSRRSRRESNLSRAAFARRFTSLTGQAPLAYLTWWRMTIAARLLLTTDASHDVIAGRVGYSSEYAFSKAFKREMGVGAVSNRHQQRATAESDAG